MHYTFHNAYIRRKISIPNSCIHIDTEKYKINLASQFYLTQNLFGYSLKFFLEPN